MTESTLTLYRVEIKGQPLQGLVDEQGGVHATRGTVLSYRANDDWYTVAELKSQLGVTKPDPKWPKKQRPRRDLASHLFSAYVFAAESPLGAREQYKAMFGILNTDDRHWVVTEAEEGAKPGLADKIVRGSKRRAG